MSHLISNFTHNPYSTEGWIAPPVILYDAAEVPSPSPDAHSTPIEPSCQLEDSPNHHDGCLGNGGNVGAAQATQGRPMPPASGYRRTSITSNATATPSPNLCFGTPHWMSPSSSVGSLCSHASPALRALAPLQLMSGGHNSILAKMERLVLDGGETAAPDSLAGSNGCRLFSSPIHPQRHPQQTPNTVNYATAMCEDEEKDADVDEEGGEEEKADEDQEEDASFIGEDSSVDTLALLRGSVQGASHHHSNMPTSPSTTATSGYWGPYRSIISTTNFGEILHETQKFIACNLVHLRHLAASAPPASDPYANQPHDASMMPLNMENLPLSSMSFDFPMLRSLIGEYCDAKTEPAVIAEVLLRNAPCAHIMSWKRLRAKRGLNHLLCYYCGAKWKTPRAPIRHHQLHYSLGGMHNHGTSTSSWWSAEMDQAF